MNSNWILRFLLRGDEYTFRSLREADVSQGYVDALRRQRKYLENAPPDITIEWQKDYVRNIIAQDQDAICGLFDRTTLIGTSGLQSIGKAAPTTVGIFVLDSARRRMGFGKTLVWASCYVGQVCCDCRLFEAGMQKENIASLRSFLACGFRIVEEGADWYRVQLRGGELQRPTAVRQVRLKRLKV